MGGAIPEIDLEKCSGCEDCVALCPTGAVQLINGKAVLVKPEDCFYCTDCEAICSSGAVRCPYEIILAPLDDAKTTKNNKRGSTPGGRAK